MSTVLNRQGAVVVDAFTLLPDDAALPDSGAVTVSLARWQAEATTLATHCAAVAVAVVNTVDVLTLTPDVLARPMLVLHFPAFGDGRGYSQARRLRDRDLYPGVIRATGAAVVADQLAMMARCGISEFALREDQALAVCQAALSPSGRPLPYQPARDLDQAVFAARQ